MAKRNRDLPKYAPIALLGTSWIVRKIVKKTRKNVNTKRTEKPRKHDETIWTLVLAVAIAIAEALMTGLLQKRNEHANELKKSEESPNREND